MFIEDHTAKVQRYLGDKRIHMKKVNNRRFNSPKFDIPILFGAELEYEVITPQRIFNEGREREHRATVANRLAPTFEDFAIVKHDGSMRNGIEVVSLPMSIDAHAEQWRPFLDAANAKGGGLTVKETCGMHIHASREWLTTLHIGKIFGFIYNKEHQKFIKLIAGRENLVYLGQHKYGDLEPKKVSDVKFHYDRYAALNITKNETIEFRFFQSTLDLNRVMQNLEFCDALIRLSWPAHASLQELTKNGIKLFCDFVSRNRKEYPHLAAFLIQHKYIKDGRKPIMVYTAPQVKPTIKIKVPKAAMNRVLRRRLHI